MSISSARNSQRGPAIEPGLFEPGGASGHNLASARHAFVDQNRLPERFRALRAGDSFVVAESGFGAGLKFLATWQAWLAATPPETAVLHFVSTESQPLSREDLAIACSYWPAELAPMAEQLLQHYPALTSGLHRVAFMADGIRLSLFFGKALEAWQDLTFTADAWFLDRFDPASHCLSCPEDYARKVPQALAAHCRRGTTAAVVCASDGDFADRSLSEAGFTLDRIPDFEGPGDLLAGSFKPAANPDALDQKNPRDEHVVIIGAGIAGSLLARNLAERGRAVTVLESGSEPANGASGNRQGALYVKLGVDFNQQSQLALSALLYSQHYYSVSGADQWHRTGLLQMTWSEQETDRQRRFWVRNDYPQEVVRPVTKDQASELTGTEVPAGGLWYPHCGWLEPDNLCRHLLDHPLIAVRFHYRVARFLPCNGRWCLSGDQLPTVTCDRIVFCSGHETPELIAAFGDFRLKPIRGQVSSLPESSIKAPRAVICGSRYLNPAFGQQCLTGATFDLHDSSPRISEQSHSENLQQLQDNIPGIWTEQAPAPGTLDGRVAFRCTTHDYQPVAGPLTDRHGRELKGVELFTGLGSKGLAYAPLLAEYIADRITAQPRALPESLARRVAPDRCRRAARNAMA